MRRLCAAAAFSIGLLAPRSSHAVVLEPAIEDDDDPGFNIDVNLGMAAVF